MTNTRGPWRLLLVLVVLAATALLTAADHEAAADEPTEEAPAASTSEDAAKAVLDDVKKAAPTVADPLPFDHAKHEKPFDRSGLTCVDCHPVGARSETVEPELPPPPRVACHSCHRQGVKGAPKLAKPTCAQCHPVREELKPESHAIGWIDDHGAEARSLRSGCETCHDRGQCIDCHDGRGALARRPHGAGWEIIHGIEARLDVASCVGCHAEETCKRCHENGGRPL